MTTPSPALLARNPRTPVPAPPREPVSSPTRTDVFNYVKSRYVPTLDEETHRWVFTNGDYRISWTEVLADLINRYPTMYSRADQPYAYVIGRLYTEHEKTSR
jgi:hypothetical protein